MALWRCNAVFVATILGVTDPHAGPVISSSDLLTYRARVEHRWKGPVDTVNVYTERDGASCGVSFSQGSQYLIYGDWNDDVQGWQPRPGQFLPPGVRTHSCSRTSRIEEALYDLHELGPPQSSVPGKALPDVSVAAMTGYLESEGNPLFWSAASALSQTPGNSAPVVEAMRRVLRTGERAQQRRAVVMLYRLGPDAKDALPDLEAILAGMRPTDTYRDFYNLVEETVMIIRSDPVTPPGMEGSDR
jgi:hypothetical protein